MSRRKTGLGRKRTISDGLEDTPMAFESPESSNIARANYNGGTLQLFIEFRRRKDEKVSRSYRFSIPPSLWVEFIQATSKGKFFAERIRPLYAGVPV